MRYLKFLIFSTALLLLTSSLLAQRFAIKAGLNAANVTGDMIDRQWGGSFPTNYQMGFHVETTVAFPISDVFFIQSGLKYNGKGHRHYSQATNAFLAISYVSEVEARLHYLDIPLTINIRIPKIGCETYVFGGGYFGVGLHGEKNFTTTFSNRTSEESDRKAQFGDGGDYKRMDYGGLFGVGMHFGALFIEVSYAIGLPDLTTTPDYAVNPTDENNNRNRLLSLSLGYRFQKKSKK